MDMKKLNFQIEGFKLRELSIAGFFFILMIGSALDGYIHFDKYLSIEGYRIMALIFMCFSINWLVKSVIIK